MPERRTSKKGVVGELGDSLMQDESEPVPHRGSDLSQSSTKRPWCRAATSRSLAISAADEDKPSLSTSLTELYYAEGLADQAQLWRELGQALGPFVYANPQVECDAVARYFDGTTRGLRYMWMRALDKASEEREAIFAVLKHKFGFFGSREYHDVVDLEQFKRFTSLVIDGAETPLAIETSFEVAMRHLRIGALINQMPSRINGLHIYTYDYDEDYIKGSFVEGTRMIRKFRGNSWSLLPEVPMQKKCGEPGSGFDSVEEFLCSDPWAHQGHVHWVHAVRPCMECVLALGQKYHLRVHAQQLLTKLNSAQPMVEICTNDRDWSSVVFPAAYIERSCKKSFERYQAWYHKVARQAQACGYSGRKLDEVIEDMPALKVGVVQVNIMIFWSESGEGTVVSVASDPKYLARWGTPPDCARKRSTWQSLASCVEALRCCRRRKGEGTDGDKDGYKPLPGSDDEADDIEAAMSARSSMRELIDFEDDDLDAEDEMQRMFKQFELMAEAEDTTHFEDTFEGVLRQLAEENSVLRMGNHTQLLTRIMLNRSADYLSIIELYTHAINRLQELLNHDSEFALSPDQIIDRVSAAKRELESLLRMVEPFVQTVIPQLREVGRRRGGCGPGEPTTPAVMMSPQISRADVDQDDEPLPERVCRHYRFDMENNLKQFVQECRTQAKLCDSLLAEYDRRATDRVNSILNFLTIVTFLVMPLQVLTGLYGMNFVHMPELRWKYGYHYFFLLAFVFTCCFSIILVSTFKRKTR